MGSSSQRDVETGSVNSRSTGSSYRNSKGNLSKSEGGTFVARSSSSEVRDWEYGLTKVNLVLFLINMATLIAAFTIFFTKDSKPEYTAVLYYTASVFERATESYQFMLKVVTDMEIVIFGLTILSFNFAQNVVTVMPFINHCYFNKMEKGKNHFKWIAHSVTSSLLTLIVAMTLGVGDLNALIPMIGCTIGWSYFLMVFETTNTSSGELNIKPRKLPFLMGIIIGCFMVPPILMAWSLGNENDAWEDGNLTATTVLIFALTVAHHVTTMANLICYFQGWGPWGVEGYEYCEKFHSVQSFLFHQGVFWTLLVASTEL